MPLARPGIAVTMIPASLFVRNDSVFDVFPVGCSTLVLAGAGAAADPGDADEDRCRPNGGSREGEDRAVSRWLESLGSTMGTCHRKRREAIPIKKRPIRAKWIRRRLSGRLSSRRRTLRS